MCEWAVEENMLRIFGDSPTGTGDFLLSCRWAVLALEPELVCPDECAPCDEVVNADCPSREVQ